MIGRDEKIQELIIKPKDELIEKLHEENCSLHHELYMQCRLVDKAEIITTLTKTISKFIHWVCKKFSVTEEEDFIRDFKKETGTCLDPEKQIIYEKDLEYDNLEL